MTTFEGLDDGELAEEIATWAGRVAAGEARLLALLAEFDRREAWAQAGTLSCAHWLSWRLGVGLKAAHERVRVARALTGLPVTAAAFAAGRLSWTQVRAVTRVAGAADEQTYVDLARHATGAQLERLVRGVRRARKIVADEADPELAAHRMRARVSYDADGSLVLSVRLPAEEGALLLAALEQARTDLDAESSAEESTRPAPATLGAALLHLARTSLDTVAAARPAAARRGRSRLVAYVDPLTGWARLPDGELLPPPAARRLTDLGRSRRLPTQPLRDLLGAIDGERCRYPSCTRRRRLHAHHVCSWAAGGTTDLANLLLVCSRHHTLIHTQGFRLTLHADRSLTVTTADGKLVPHHTTPPWQEPTQPAIDATVTADTLPPTLSGQRLDLDYAVAVLMQQAA